MSVITTLLQPAAPAAAATRSTAWAIPTGFAAGAAFGVIARIWMRLITDDPEFTWVGTSFIVGAFAVFGAVQAAAWSGRRRGWGRPALTATRAVAIVLTLPIFTGAGSIMLPVVLGASLATWRSDWHRAIRAAVALLSAPIAVSVAVQIVREFGVAPATAVRVVLFGAIYAAVIIALGATVAPQRDGWRITRRTAIISAVALAGAVGFVVVASLTGI